MAAKHSQEVDKMKSEVTESVCDDEFEEIQMALEGISKDLGAKLNTNTTDEESDYREKGHKSSINLEQLLSCDTEDFMETIRSMQVPGNKPVVLYSKGMTNNSFLFTSERKPYLVLKYKNTYLIFGAKTHDKMMTKCTVYDLELAILVFEEHIKARKRGSNADKQQPQQPRSMEDHKNLKMYRDRLNRCFLEKVRRTKDPKTPSTSSSDSQKSNVGDTEPRLPRKPKRYIVRASASPDEFENMTDGQLRSLLRHHSIEHPSDADKDFLMELVIDEVLQGEGGDWEPPTEDEMQWAAPISQDRENIRLSRSCAMATSGTHFKGRQMLLCYGCIEEGNKESTPAIVDRDETDWHKAVPITDQKSMLDWDPVPLLKELYKPITQSSSDEAAKNKPDTPPKMTGYLEKLPVNQIKPKAFKGWKRRYFKIEKGKIYYYEDHKPQSPPLGSLTLRGSRITVREEKMIQITAENSDTMVLKCGTSNESKDWYRVLHEEAVASLKRKALNGDSDAQSSPVVVVDLGATTIRGGLASEGLPTVAFPAVYAVKLDRGSNRKFTSSGVPDPHLCTCGFDAFRPQNRKVSKLIYPLKPSLKIDKYAVKVRYLPGFIEKVFQSMYASPNNSVVILSCPQYLGDQEKEYLLDYLFGQLNVKAAYIQQQAVLALYSYSDTSGIIVDLGDHIDVIPVVEGNIVNHGRTSLPYGGQQITENLSKLLANSGYRYFSEIEAYIVRYVKEKCAFVLDEAISDRNVTIPKAVVDVKPFSLPNHEKVIEADIAQVKCTEGLFEPSLWGKDDKGLHHIVANAIKACGIDERREICRKIYLTGGTTLLRGLRIVEDCALYRNEGLKGSIQMTSKGLGERLQKELKKLLPDGLTIQVQAGESRLNAAFKGASLLSKLPTFSKVLITKEDWQAHGAEILSRWHQQ